MNSGKGSLGKLAKDPALANKVEESITRLNLRFYKGSGRGQGTPLGQLVVNNTLYDTLDKTLTDTGQLVFHAIRPEPQDLSHHSRQGLLATTVNMRKTVRSPPVLEIIILQGGDSPSRSGSHIQFYLFMCADGPAAPYQPDLMPALTSSAPQRILNEISIASFQPARVVGVRSLPRLC